MPHVDPPADAFGGEDVQEQLQVQMDRLREGLAQADFRVRQAVREHPVLSVLGAVALGYFVGRVAKRR